MSPQDFNCAKCFVLGATILLSCGGCDQMVNPLQQRAELVECDVRSRDQLIRNLFSEVADDYHLTSVISDQSGPNHVFIGQMGNDHGTIAIFGNNTRAELLRSINPFVETSDLDVQHLDRAMAELKTRIYEVC